VNRGQLRIWGALVLAASMLGLGASRAAAQLKSVPGKLTGVVRDSSGTPEMGATVEVFPETASLAAINLLTNTRGMFQTDRLAPGFYTVRVTLAGFLPSLEKHVRITPNLTTLVRIQLQSMFASLEQLRHAPSATSSNADDWKWVLRSAPSMRPVLQWMESDSPDSPTFVLEQPKVSRARLEFTDGARRPGSVSNLPSSPATAVAYDQKLGGTSRLLLAGQVSYESDVPAGGIATVWLPTGSLGAGPHTALVLRESKLGETGPTFRAVRIDQGGSMGFGDRAVLRYGGEYVLVGLGRPASVLRPRMELQTRISEQWGASLIFASLPSGPVPLEAGEGEGGNALAAALNEFDAFPTLLWRGGRAVLQNGWHQEISAERKLGSRSSLQVAGFHDDNRHVAVFGRGDGLPVTDYFPDPYSDGFAYDGGHSSSWGGRAAFKEKLGNDVELSAVYAFAGALTPSSAAVGPLREAFRTAGHHSVGTRVSGKVPHLATRLSAGYKWTSGVTISRLDSFGESLYFIDPYFHLGIHQPLPKFAPGRWEANAECDNLLAQGYVSLSSQDGRVTLMPLYRTFRGGVSLQF
jgi:hypothetical protein